MCPTAPPWALEMALGKQQGAAGATPGTPWTRSSQIERTRFQTVGRHPCGGARSTRVLQDLARRLGRLFRKPAQAESCQRLARTVVEQALLGSNAPAGDERVPLLGVRELSLPTVHADERPIRLAGRLADEAPIGRRGGSTRPVRLNVEPAAPQVYPQRPPVAPHDGHLGRPLPRAPDAHHCVLSERLLMETAGPRQDLAVDQHPAVQVDAHAVRVHLGGDRADCCHLSALAPRHLPHLNVRAVRRLEQPELSGAPRGEGLSAGQPVVRLADTGGLPGRAVVRTSRAIAVDGSLAAGTVVAGGAVVGCDGENQAACGAGEGVDALVKQAAGQADQICSAKIAPGAS